MSREKHPIHAVAKKAGQLNQVLRAIIGEGRPNHDSQRPRFGCPQCLDGLIVDNLWFSGIGNSVATYY